MLNICVPTPLRECPWATLRWEECLTLLQFGFVSPDKHRVALSDPMFQPRDYLPFLSTSVLFHTDGLAYIIVFPTLHSPMSTPQILATFKPSTHVLSSLVPFPILATSVVIFFYASITIFLHFTWLFTLCIVWWFFLHIFSYALNYNFIVFLCLSALTLMYKPKQGLTNICW